MDRRTKEIQRTRRQLDKAHKQLQQRTFRDVKARMLRMLADPKLSPQEKRVDKIMRRHLAGYTGVISHRTWSDLRSELGALLERRRNSVRARTRAF